MTSGGLKRTLVVHWWVDRFHSLSSQMRHGEVPERKFDCVYVHLQSRATTELGQNQSTHTLFHTANVSHSQLLSLFSPDFDFVFPFTHPLSSLSFPLTCHFLVSVYSSHQHIQSSDLRAQLSEAEESVRAIQSELEKEKQDHREITLRLSQVSLQQEQNTQHCLKISTVYPRYG